MGQEETYLELTRDSVEYAAADPADPRDPGTVAEHAELVADLIVRGLEHHQA